MKIPDELKEPVNKKCIICGNEYTVYRSSALNRLYCYECSPIQKGTNGSESVRLRKRAIKHQLLLYKGGKCERCGYDKCEGALQFHHVNPQEKDFTIGQIKLGKDYTMEDLYKEVDKCVLLCANCHAEEHFME